MLKLCQGGKSTFERELNVLSDCKCEFIIKLYAIYEFPDGKGLILEYSQRSLGTSWICDSVKCNFNPLFMNLGSFLHDKPPNIENEKFYHLGHVVRWMRCAAEGLRYLHNASPEPIIHRDIKPDNCLLFDDGLRNVVSLKKSKYLLIYVS